jgi:hypothetical protein
MGGSLECLKYAHEHGCPWSKYICEEAARAGYIECLKYAHEHGCSWDRLCFRVASGVCLEYLISNSCPQ